MSEPAVPAPDGKVPAADSQVVGAGDMAVTAFGCFNEFPEIITADFNILSFPTDIFYPGNENPGCPAVVTDHLSLEWHGRDDLVGHFLTVITVSSVACEDEPVAHER